MLLPRAAKNGRPAASSPQARKALYERRDAISAIRGSERRDSGAKTRTYLGLVAPESSTKWLSRLSQRRLGAGNHSNPVAEEPRLHRGRPEQLIQSIRFHQLMTIYGQGLHGVGREA